MSRRAMTSGPVVTEPSALDFVPGYLFAGEDVTQGAQPGYEPDIATGNPVDPSPNWAIEPASETPGIIPQSNDGDSTWLLWPASGAPTLAIVLPNGSDIRSLWIPNIPFAFGVALSVASGSPVYRVTQQGGEIIPIPKGCTMLVLSALPTAIRSDIYVYATHDRLDPNKTGVYGAPIPFSGALSPYDHLVLSVSNILYYWPMSDASNSTSVAQIGIGVNTAGVPTDCTFGGGALNKAGTSSIITSETSAISFPFSPSFPFTLEFWFAVTALAGSTIKQFLITTSGAGEYGLYVDGGTGVLAQSQNNLEVWSSGIGVADGKPHYCCILYPGTGSVMPVNYALDGVLLPTAGAYDGAFYNPMGVGNYGSNGPGNIGAISQLAFYTRVLTASEIAARWAAYHL